MYSVSRQMMHPVCNIMQKKIMFYQKLKFKKYEHLDI